MSINSYIDVVARHVTEDELDDILSDIHEMLDEKHPDKEVRAYKP